MGKVYKNENQVLLPRMLEIYQPTDFDWNELFMDINVCKKPPADEHIKEMILLKTKTKRCIYK